MRDRSYYSILINKDNKIAKLGRPINIDSLESDIIDYLSKVGIDDLAPDNYEKVNFKLMWDRKSDHNFIDTVMTKVYKAHLSFVEKQVQTEGLDFCDIDLYKIKELKKEYPLRIELDLGKNAKWSIIFDEELENIEVDSVVDLFDKKPKR